VYNHRFRQRTKVIICSAIFNNASAVENFIPVKSLIFVEFDFCEGVVKIKPANMKIFKRFSITASKNTNIRLFNTKTQYDKNAK
jgi:hypothetical protein